MLKWAQRVPPHPHSQPTDTAYTRMNAIAGTSCGATGYKAKGQEETSRMYH